MLYFILNPIICDRMNIVEPQIIFDLVKVKQYYLEGTRHLS